MVAAAAESPRSVAASRNPEGPLRIHVVDDHPIFRRGVAALVADCPGIEICAESDGDSATLDQMRRSAADVYLIDIALAGGSGIDLVKRLRSGMPECRILMVSNHSESAFAERALRAGASGYLNKREAGPELLTAIRQIAEGSYYLNGSATDQVIRQMVHSSADDDSTVSSLSDRELQVYSMVGQGMNKHEIAAKLHLSTKTVDTYREHIKAKLSLRDMSELVRSAVHWSLLEGAS